METLVVPFGFSLAGKRCRECGRLAVRGSHCPVCGGTLEAVADIAESAVAAALRQGSRVEILSMIANGNGQEHQVGALLRF